jgi:hypothetical protein
MGSNEKNSVARYSRAKADEVALAVQFLDSFLEDLKRLA